MLLTDFLEALLATGQVTVAGEITPFDPADRAAATARLRAYYAADRQELAGAAPAFAPDAAGWAAELLYRTVQLAFLRDYDEAAVAEHLPDGPAPASPEAMYSADLSLRYLPALLDLARGLAPADPLVQRLQALAGQWPLSFVGARPAPAEAPAAVLAHPALRTLYLDRIVARRDLARAQPPEVADGIRAALGAHGALLWPELGW